ncbi:MAG: hypothetical protein ACR2KI_05755, partial [Candidatus Limnocylindria bacterium]
TTLGSGTTLPLPQLVPGTSEAPPNYSGTNGSVIVWSAGTIGTPSDGPWPDLMSFDPNTRLVERIFVNRNRDSRLMPIALGGGHVAFTELNPRLYGPSGWRLWYVASRGAPAMLLDRSDPPGGVEGPIPFAAVDGTRVAWATFHATPAGRRAEIRMASLPSLAQRVLLSADEQRTEYWFPGLDGARLVFSTVEYNANRTADARHVYLLDLSQPAGRPMRLDSTGDAAAPAIHGDDVVWKRSNNELNWGSLVLHSLTTGRDLALDFGDQSQLLGEPSIGNRYVAAEASDYHTLRLYDLTTRSAIVVDTWPERGAEGAFGPHVAGDLLVFAHGVAEVGGRGELRWARLMPP